MFSSNFLVDMPLYCSNPDPHHMAHGTVLIADAMASNKRQAITNNHIDYNTTWTILHSFISSYSYFTKYAGKSSGCRQPHDWCVVAAFVFPQL